MKKYICLLMLLCLLFSLTGCFSLLTGSEDINITSSTDEETLAIEEQSQPTNASVQGDFVLVMWQKLFTDKNNIHINDFTAEQNKLHSFLDRMTDEPKAISIANIFGPAQYKLTAESSDYLYCGETKGNYPSGYGIVLMESKDRYGITQFGNKFYDLVYAGSFKEGKYNGYGIEFCEPANEAISDFSSIYNYKSTPEEYAAHYLGWVNYAEYEGNHKDGYREGKGNLYLIDHELHTQFSGRSFAAEQIDNIRYDTISIGTFSRGKLNGKCKIYVGKVLSYDGEMKDDKRDGYGSDYSVTGYLEYQGEFRKDERHGKGTLYDSEGQVIYEGKWEDGDYK